jgi:hypothetical protein
LFPAEPVYAVVEVKSILDGKALGDIFRKCTLAKALKKSAFFEQHGELHNFVSIYGREMEHFPIMFFAITAFAIDPITIVKSLETYDERSGAEKSVDAVCSIENGRIVCWWNNKDDKYDLVWSPDTRRAVLSAGEHTLGLFYIMLHRWLSQASCRPFSMAHYFGPGELARRVYPAPPPQIS